MQIFMHKKYPIHLTSAMSKSIGIYIIEDNLFAPFGAMEFIGTQYANANKK